MRNAIQVAIDVSLWMVAIVGGLLGVAAVVWAGYGLVISFTETQRREPTWIYSIWTLMLGTPPAVVGVCAVGLIIWRRKRSG